MLSSPYALVLVCSKHTMPCSLYYEYVLGKFLYETLLCAPGVEIKKLFLPFFCCKVRTSFLLI